MKRVYGLLFTVHGFFRKAKGDCKIRSPALTLSRLHGFNPALTVFSLTPAALKPPSPPRFTTQTLSLFFYRCVFASLRETPFLITPAVLKPLRVPRFYIQTGNNRFKF